MAGRIVRQGRLLTVLFLTAAFLTPVASEAQDVMVLPGSSAPATSATVFEAPPIAAPTADTAPENTADVSVAPQLARQQPEPTAAPAPDPAVVASPPSLARAPASQAVVSQQATVAAPGVVAAQPLFDVNFQQCTTDADCVLVEDGCTTLGAVNQASVKQWKAVMTHYPECVPIHDLTKLQLTLMATCRLGWCGVQPRTK